MNKRCILKFIVDENNIGAPKMPNFIRVSDSGRSFSLKGDNVKLP